jgi:hypothetical protein
MPFRTIQLYDYPKIITRMMDLGTVKSKLRKSKYAHASECAEDVRQIWTNCMTYNDDGSDFYRLAHSYSRRFEERYQKLVDEFGEDAVRGVRPSGGVGGGGIDDGGDDDDGGDAPGNGDGCATTPRRPNKAGGRRPSKPGSNSITPLAPAATPTAAANAGGGGDGGGGGAGSASASKAENRPGGGNRDPTSDVVPLDVRTRFAARLQRLSGMELGHVLQTIDLRCPEALEDPDPESLASDAPPPIRAGHRYAWDEFDGGCQVEVDVDAIPPETFWELDRYVKERVHGRGRGAWSDDVTEAEPGGGGGGGGGGKRRRMKSV